MNRCRHDIIYNLLASLTAEPKRITDLCSAGNLPVDRGKVLVQNIERFGLLIKTGGDDVFYNLTARGYEWIGLYELLRKVLP